MSEFTDLSLENRSVTDSEFTVIGRPTPSPSEVDAISSIETASASDRSQFYIITTTDSSYEIHENQFDAPYDVDNTPIHASTPTLAPKEDGPTHLLTRENLTWKLIEEVAGGNVRRFSQMMISDLKAKGVNFPLDAGMLSEGELIGDQIPGYESMALGHKLYSWWTRKQRSIIDAQILKELQQHAEEEAANIAKTPVVDSTRKNL
jgi:hypothetical protein